jgi:hypothetical protein
MNLRSRQAVVAVLAGLSFGLAWAELDHSVHWDHLTGTGFVEAAVPSAPLGAKSFYVSLSFRTTQKVRRGCVMISLLCDWE